MNNNQGMGSAVESGTNTMKTVLIIDDDDVDRERLRRALETEASDLVVVEADSLETGIDLSHQREIDVVVLDLRLQSTSGLETLHAFRAHVVHLPVVLVSGIADEQLAMDSINEGADDFVNKNAFESRWFKIVLLNACRRFAMKQQVLESTEKLERANQGLQQFAYIVSHDLQEPLRAIRGFGEILQRDTKESMDQNNSTKLTRIVDSAARMQQLIHDLLEYARHSTDEMHCSRVDLNDCVEFARLNLQTSIEESKAQFEVSTLPTVSGTSSQLNQLFQNLIGNAIKYRKSDASPLISIAAVEKDKEIEVTVSDNGIGIDSDYQDSIFDVFSRAQSRDDYPGTGIGLAICNKVVERHGGSLTVQSIVGEGSTFCIRLPH